MKYLTIILLIGLMAGIVEAPTTAFYCVRVRLTKYSPKQRGETHKNAMGGRLREGDLSSYMVPLGTKIQMPDGSFGIVKDRPAKWAHKKFGGKLVDECLIESIKSRPKTKSVNKELRKYDMGWGVVKIYR